jgi:hypothetical protein
MKLSGDRSLCRACGEHFNSTYAFDKHRTGDLTMRRCRRTAEMIELGMSKNAKGLWVSKKHSDSSKRRVQSSRDLGKPMGEQG